MGRAIRLLAGLVLCSPIWAEGKPEMWAESMTWHGQESAVLARAEKTSVENLRVVMVAFDNDLYVLERKAAGEPFGVTSYNCAQWGMKDLTQTLAEIENALHWTQDPSKAVESIHEALKERNGSPLKLDVGAPKTLRELLEKLDRKLGPAGAMDQPGRVDVTFVLVG